MGGSLLVCPPDLPFPPHWPHAPGWALCCVARAPAGAGPAQGENEILYLDSSYCSSLLSAKPKFLILECSLRIQRVTPKATHSILLNLLLLFLCDSRGKNTQDLSATDTDLECRGNDDDRAPSSPARNWPLRGIPQVREFFPWGSSAASVAETCTLKPPVFSCCLGADPLGKATSLRDSCESTVACGEGLALSLWLLCLRCWSGPFCWFLVADQAAIYSVTSLRFSFGRGTRSMGVMQQVRTYSWGLLLASACLYWQGPASLPQLWAFHKSASPSPDWGDCWL